HQLDGVGLELLDVRALDEDVQAVEATAAAGVAAPAAAAEATARGAGNVGAARHADARALILAKHLARPDHQLLLGYVPFFQRHHHDVEAREPGTHVLHHAVQRRQREDLFFDRLDEFF